MMMIIVTIYTIYIYLYIYYIYVLYIFLRISRPCCCFTYFIILLILFSYLFILISFIYLIYNSIFHICSQRMQSTVLESIQSTVPEACLFVSGTRTSFRNMNIPERCSNSFPEPRSCASLTCKERCTCAKLCIK